MKRTVRKKHSFYNVDISSQRTKAERNGRSALISANDALGSVQVKLKTRLTSSSVIISTNGVIYMFQI
jgi:hypothetical protein